MMQKADLLLHWLTCMQRQQLARSNRYAGIHADAVLQRRPQEMEFSWPPPLAVQQQYKGTARAPGSGPM
jgi:hypothetical protein